MIKEMNGWKVLYHRYSCGNQSNRYIITYPVNIEAKPFLAGSKLFFFETKKDAKNFCNENFSPCIDFHIVPCIAYNCEKTTKIAFLISDIENFWNGNIHDTDIAPTGTWIAESIKCLE